MTDAKKPGKSIDVTSADDTPADEPKPVVITKRAILKAPSTAPPLDENNPATSEAAVTQSIKKPLKPLIQPLENSPDEPAKIQTATEKPADQAGTAESAPAKAEATTDKPEATETKPAEKDAAAEKPAAKPEPAASDSDKVGGENTGDESDDKSAGPSEEELEAEAQAQAKHDEAIQKLVDGKQYFLPINAVEKRKTKHFIVLGIFVSVLLALAWADIALDAGLVQIPGVKPVTHFFSN